MAARIVCMVICLLMTVKISTPSDIFTSVIAMENLVKTQDIVIDSIENYIAKEEEKLRTLKRLLVPYKQSQEKALQDVPYYVQNPINAFKLIKRLSVGLDYIKSIMYGPPNYQTSEEVIYPDKEDLEGAGEAIIRIQAAYDLNITEISRGVLKTNYSSDHKQYEEKFAPMSSSDCYEVGKVAYDNNYIVRALPWILEAFAKNALEDVKDDSSFINVTHIVELICFSYIALGDIDNSKKWIKELTVLQSKYTDYKMPLEIIEYLIQVEKNAVEKKPNVEEAEQRKTYYELCRGNIKVPADDAKRLTCRYLTDSHPYLTIAPIKAEQLSIDPYVMLVYDVVNDDEIETLKKHAHEKKLRRAGVRQAETGQSVHSKIRISQTAWLEDDMSDIAATLSRRVHHFTGLTLDTAEKLQVAIYGIGGVYEGHNDFNSNASLVPTTGQRVATIVFYLSDVTQGGATVFLNLKLTVFPVKGAALFWTNLYDTGALDLRLLHAACPVLRGSKWAANKWLHEHGQEWVRPCPTKPKHKVRCKEKQ